MELAPRATGGRCVPGAEIHPAADRRQERHPRRSGGRVQPLHHEGTPERQRRRGRWQRARSPAPVLQGAFRHEGPRHLHADVRLGEGQRRVGLHPRGAPRPSPVRRRVDGPGGLLRPIAGRPRRLQRAPLLVPGIQAGRQALGARRGEQQDRPVEPGRQELRREVPGAGRPAAVLEPEQQRLRAARGLCGRGDHPGRAPVQQEGAVHGREVSALLLRRSL
ncbi:hypothetical protein D3C81_1564250 [compost metagenome]